MSQQEINNSDTQNIFPKSFQLTQQSNIDYNYTNLGMNINMNMDAFNEKMSLENKEKEGQNDSLVVSNSISAKTLNNLNLKLNLDDKGDIEPKFNSFNLKNNEAHTNIHFNQPQVQGNSGNSNQILKRNSDKGSLGLNSFSNVKQPSPLYSYYDTSQKYLINSLHKDGQNDDFLNPIQESANFIRKSSLDEEDKLKDYSELHNPFNPLDDNNNSNDLGNNSNTLNVYEDYNNIQSNSNPNALNMEYNFFNSSQNNQNQTQNQSEIQDKQPFPGSPFPIMNNYNFHQMFRNSNNNHDYSNTNSNQSLNQLNGMGMTIGFQGMGMNNIGMSYPFFNNNDSNKGINTNNQFNKDMASQNTFQICQKDDNNNDDADYYDNDYDYDDYDGNDGNDKDNNNNKNGNKNGNKNIKSEDYIYEKFGKKGWMCEKCSNFNFENRMKCNRCSLPKQPKFFKYDKMKNANITFANPFNAIALNPIMQTEEKKRKPFAERTGDWRCLNCHNLNFSFRLICNMCQIPKSQSLSSSNDINISSMNMINPIFNPNNYIPQLLPGQNQKQYGKGQRQRQCKHYMHQDNSLIYYKKQLQKQQEIYQMQFQQQSLNPYSQNMQNNQFNMYNNTHDDYMQKKMPPSKNPKINNNNYNNHNNTNIFR